MAKIDEGYDVVSGWRKDRQDAFMSRKLPSRIANALISKVSGVHLHDYGCTLKATAARSDRPPLRRDAPLHPDLCVLDRRQGHRGPGQPSRESTAPRSTDHAPSGHPRSLVVKFLGSFTKPIYFFGSPPSCALGIASEVWTLYDKYMWGSGPKPLPDHRRLPVHGGHAEPVLGLLRSASAPTQSQTRPIYFIKDRVNITGSRVRGLSITTGTPSAPPDRAAPPPRVS
jgi:hypothetical protein